jgi:hypothetical protein
LTYDLSAKNVETHAWISVMSVVSAPVSAIFLILVAASTAVVVSMVVLALFDRAFVKKKSLAAKEVNDEQQGSPERMTGKGRSKPKSSAVLRHHSKARYQSGCGPQTQRMRNFG